MSQRRLKNDHPLNGFFSHGVPRTENISSNHYISQCPFCEHEDKLYINLETKLWDCKVCGKAGNYLQFLEEISKINAEHIKPTHWDALAEDRNLPVAAFKDYGIGWDGHKFTLPTRNIDGKFTGLKCYRPGFAFYLSKDTKPELFCADRIKENHNDPVYICEGEWDCIALTWLLKRLNKPGVVVAVPSANTLKDEWAEYFYQRDVIALYDHDDAGAKGETRCYGMLQNLAKSMKFVQWPEEKPEGYDVRDLVSKIAHRKKQPKRCWRRLHDWLQVVPRSLLNESTRGKDGKYTLERRDENLKPISFPDLIAEFKKFLYLPDITPIKVMLATVLANRVSGGEMLWMFMVAPPSTAKTELLTSLFQSREIVSLTTLTPNTLISGFIGVDKVDHSLLPKLTGKVLVIKDFTGVLSMPEIAKSAIFGQLRDAYDGKSEKFFGNGLTRSYEKLHFGILAGVTNTIENINIMQQTLGERFLRYYLPIHNSENEITSLLRRAMSNVSKERDKQFALQQCVVRFLKNFEGTAPEISVFLQDKIGKLARMCAFMRGIVPRDFKGDKILYSPQKEGPVRIAKQFYKLSVALASLEKKTEVTEEEFEIIRQIGVGSCPSRVTSIIEALYRAQGKPYTIHELLKVVGYNFMTIKFVVEDMLMLKLLTEQGGHLKYYTLSKEAVRLIREGGVFAEEKKKRIYTLAAPGRSGTSLPVKSFKSVLAHR